MTEPAPRTARQKVLTTPTWTERHPTATVLIVLAAGLLAHPLVGLFVAGAVALRSRGKLRIFALVMAGWCLLVLTFLTPWPYWHAGVTGVTTGGH